MFILWTSRLANFNLDIFATSIEKLIKNDHPPQNTKSVFHVFHNFVKYFPTLLSCLYLCTLYNKKPQACFKGSNFSSVRQAGEYTFIFGDNQWKEDVV